MRMFESITDVDNTICNKEDLRNRILPVAEELEGLVRESGYYPVNPWGPSKKDSWEFRPDFTLGDDEKWFNFHSYSEFSVDVNVNESVAIIIPPFNWIAFCEDMKLHEIAVRCIHLLAKTLGGTTVIHASDELSEGDCCTNALFPDDDVFTRPSINDLLICFRQGGGVENPPLGKSARYGYFVTYP